MQIIKTLMKVGGVHRLRSWLVCVCVCGTVAGGAKILECPSDCLFCFNLRLTKLQYRNGQTCGKDELESAAL